MVASLKDAIERRLSPLETASGCGMRSRVGEVPRRPGVQALSPRRAGGRRRSPGPESRCAGQESLSRTFLTHLQAPCLLKKGLGCVDKAWLTLGVGPGAGHCGRRFSCAPWAVRPDCASSLRPPGTAEMDPSFAAEHFCDAE